MQTTQMDHDLWDAVTEALARTGARFAPESQAAGDRSEAPATRRKPRDPSLSGAAPAR